ncbi:OmpH family outer membrane protein [Dyadobacter psychrotolerans]|uniref:OmpH family outer membrane protein n=1 Tax=Dyadobacter psychrotolerans TaxID=2541721 RepID=A0A4R5DV21_9BACT|nr:OmpH family outer membrane protein [Dyadobacter psychrotolerans]TDE18362.1 OmpH family outer membrane protein [Dyadobacter psychrotolerans]
MRSLSSIFFTAFLFLAAGFVQAQDMKIGHVDQQYIFANLPEFKKLNQEITEKSEQYDKILKSKFDEFETKRAVFEKLVSGQASDAILKDKATELENLKKSYEEFQNNSTTELRNYYGRKFTPIKKKVNDAIVFAGRQKGYTFLLRMDLNPDGGDLWPVVLYAQDTTATLTSEILKNLGVDSTAASARKIGIPQMMNKK